jgi:hypothetical protein
MKSLNGVVLLSALLAITLTACNNGSSSSSENQLKSGFAAKAANDEPDAIYDPQKLQSDINTLFGGPNSEPVAVNDGDTLKSVINRQ